MFCAVAATRRGLSSTPSDLLELDGTDLRREPMEGAQGNVSGPGEAAGKARGHRIDPVRNTIGMVDVAALAKGPDAILTATITDTSWRTRFQRHLGEALIVPLRPAIFDRGQTPKHHALGNARIKHDRSLFGRGTPQERPCY
jgi:hypothetical protein